MVKSEFGKLHIKKRAISDWLALLILLVPFTFSFLTEFLGLPGVVRMSTDLLLFLVAIPVVHRSFTKGVLTVPKMTAPLAALAAIFFAYTLVTYMFNFQSPFYYVWGARNYLRFYIAFFVFIAFFSVDDANDCLKVFDILFWVHAAVTFFQFFVMGYSQDLLGGIFGVQKGCNGYVIFFMSIVVMKSLLSFMNGNEGTVICALKCGTSLLIAALAELKFFFFLFIIILVIAAVITRFSAKKAALMLFAGVFVIVAATILVSLFDSFENFLSIDYLISHIFRKNYASKEDLGRFTAIPTICKIFLTTLPEQLFGMGLGNCDTSTMPIFNTPFHNAYYDIHYSIFSVSFLFIETGFIGLALYVAFFVITLVKSVGMLRRGEGNLLFNQMALITSLLCFTFIFYNSSLRTEAGYMIYFVLALPFIGKKCSNRDMLSA